MRAARSLAVLVVLLFSAASAMAAGFRLPEAGAKAMGMGFAFTAQADDPSAIYFNPAGLTQLEGTNVMLGVTYARENGGEFTGSTPLTGGAVVSETQKDLNFWIPNGYVVRKASPKFAYGVGVFSPFGLGQEYRNPATSIFRNQITKIELLTLVVNPSVAWQVNEFVSFGAGIDFMWGDAELKRTPVLAPGAQFMSRLKGDGTAWGYNLGVLVKATRNLRIGLSYRSPFTLDIKGGDVTLSDNTVPIPLPASSKAHTTIRMPATAAIGAVYAFGDLTVEADVDVTLWHSFSDLTIVNETTPLLSTSTDKDWEDAVAFRIGAEYRVTKPLAIRAGFAVDLTPVPSRTMGPELPDSNRLQYTLGAGYTLGNWTIDGAYLFVHKRDRTVKNLNQNGPGTGFSGTWKGDAHLVALDVGYRF